MTASYCHSCYRDLDSGRGLCVSCADRAMRTRPAARLPLLIGFLGLPLLIFGLLRPSDHACVAGAVLAGGGVLAHVAVRLYGD